MPVAWVASTVLLKCVSCVTCATLAILIAGDAAADISVAAHAEAGVVVEEGRVHAALVAHVHARLHLGPVFILHNLDSACKCLRIVAVDLATLAAPLEGRLAVCAVTIVRQPVGEALAVEASACLIGVPPLSLITVALATNRLNAHVLNRVALQARIWAAALRAACLARRARRSICFQEVARLALRACSICFVALKAEIFAASRADTVFEQAPWLALGAGGCIAALHAAISLALHTVGLVLLEIACFTRIALCWAWDRAVSAV